MKTTLKLVPALVISGLAALAITSGCTDKEPPPPPPNVAVVGFLPDYCFWDGYEYIGWVGTDYYYWSPRHVWVISDPVRVQRANVWMKAHPEWASHVANTAQPKPKIDNHPQVQHPPKPPPEPHPKDHDQDRDK